MRNWAEGQRGGRGTPVVTGRSKTGMITGVRCDCCGTENPGYARFCGQCGSGLIAHTKTIRPQPSPLGIGPVEEFADPARAARMSQQMVAVRSSRAVGNRTMAMAGITSAKKVYTWMGLAAAGLVALGAAGMWFLSEAEPRVVGNAEPGAPVMIGEIAPAAEHEAMHELPAREEQSVLPEGVVPPGADDTSSEDVQEPSPTEIQEPRVSSMRPTRMTSRRQVSPRPTRPQGVEPSPPLQPAQRPAPEPSAPPPPWQGRPAPEPTSEPPPAPTVPPAGGVGSSQTGVMYASSARRLVATRYVGDVQTCFDQADARVPGLSGSIVMAFVLHEDGRIASARPARNTTGDSGIANCLTQRSRGWRLPPPPPRTLEFRMTFAR